MVEEGRYVVAKGCEAAEGGKNSAKMRGRKTILFSLRAATGNISQLETISWSLISRLSTS